MASGGKQVVGLSQRFGFILLAVCASFVLAFGVVGCSSGPTVGSSSGDDYSVAEYNADIDKLGSILAEARTLYNQINSIDTSRFTTQQEVDQYNSMVNRYNALAEEYGEAVREFNKKYAANADGDGTRGTDPNNIQLPQKK